MKGGPATASERDVLPAPAGWESPGAWAAAARGFGPYSRSTFWTSIATRRSPALVSYGRGSKRPVNATAWPLTGCSAAASAWPSPEEQIDVDRVGLAVAAVAGHRDGRDAHARADGAQPDVAGQAAVAGEGEHLWCLLVGWGEVADAAGLMRDTSNGRGGPPLMRTLRRVAGTGSYAGSNLSATQAHSTMLSAGTQSRIALCSTRLAGLWSRRPREPVAGRSTGFNPGNKLSATWSNSATSTSL